ncbi:MAG: hypothetical protein AAGG51_18670 [Cyanobacteria bacterium P01_G01_bin.54]
MTQRSNASFLGLALQGATSNLIRDTLKNLGIPLRNSLHDGHEEHQVAEITRGYLEFYAETTEHNSIVLALESDNLEDSLGTLPEGFEVTYKGETELENYTTVIICDYPPDFQVKIYERAEHQGTVES